MKYFSALKKQVKEIHTKKPHIEFFTALLTVPVLLTVIILNLNNLKGANSTKETPKSETIVITQGPPEEKTKEIIINKEACKAGVGDVSIVSPDESENVSDNPVAVDISYDENIYCQVIWSYRVNGGTWSSYDDRSVALYNLSNGDVKLEVRIKSTVNNEIKSLTRRFTYSGSTSPTPTQGITPTISQ